MHSTDNLQVVTTGDGSRTLHMPDLKESYHSAHGAWQEALHVFIRAGLHPAMERHEELRILEVGFGTGMNALLTLEEATKRKCHVQYHTVERYPLSWEQVSSLGYQEKIGDPTIAALWKEMHVCPCEEMVSLHPGFELVKYQQDVLEMDIQAKFDLIYYDAFGARVQPELWTDEAIAHACSWLAPKGYWVTYAAKGSVKRALKSIGLIVESLEGPPGKREMTRASKN